MWLFKANYIDMNTDKIVSEKIEFDGQFFDSDKECFLYAMSRAIEKQKDNILFCSLEFIAC